MDEKIEELKSIEQLEELKKQRILFYQCHEGIVDRLKYYCDLKEDSYLLDCLWILGTYFHHNFPTFPYLFFNAMKGSGKTRLLKLIAFLSKDGEVLNSLTEAVLFRERGTLCIDEFENISRAGKENLKELLNSCYKKGTKVKRLKKVKNVKTEGVSGLSEEQVVEKFEVYRPIAMANIWGMEDVLGDRCITQILEKSDKADIINLVEIFDTDDVLVNIKNTLNAPKSPVLCSLCSVVSLYSVYKCWNDFTKLNYITTHTTYTTNNYTNYTKEELEELFNKIKESGIDGRNLELSFPLILIAFELDKIAKNDLMLENIELTNTIIKTMKELVSERKSEEFLENKDVLIIDFLSQEIPNNNYISVSALLQRFKDFTGLNEENINAWWFGRRLKTLKMVKERKREGQGVKIIPNYEHAQEKIKMFR